MLRAVLFDLGGTLHVSTTTPERKIWFAQRVIDRLGEYGISLDADARSLSRQLEINAEIYKRDSEESMRELAPEVIWNDYFLKEQAIGRERLAVMGEELAFLYDYERVCNLRRPHLNECMRALKDRGLRLGVISNIISRTIVPHFLAEYGIADFMEVVLTSADTGIRKPDPAIFRLAEQKMGLTPEEFAYVGDTISRDVRGVRSAGWRTMIQIESPASRRRDGGMEGLGYKADYRIVDLMEIPEIIDREREERP